MKVTKFLGKAILKNKIMVIAIIVLFSSVIFLFNYLYLGVLDVSNNFNDMIEKSEVSNCQYIPQLEMSDEEIAEIIEDYNIPLEETKDDNFLEKYDVDLEPYFEKRMQEINDKYDLTYEKFNFKVVNHNGKAFFITNYNGKLNSPLFSSECELNSSEVYVTNEAKNSSIELNNKDYDVVGEFSSIDFIQLYDVKKSPSNLAIDNVGVYMSKNEYDKLDIKEQYFYNLQFKSNEEYNKFLDEYEKNAILCKDTDKYMANFKDVISMNFRLSYIAIISYFVVTIVIFYITYKNLLDSLDKEFGLLKIIGVKNKTIILSVLAIYIIILFIAGILANLLGVITQNAIRAQFRPLYNFIYLNDYLFVKERLLFTLFIIAFVIMITSILLYMKLSNRILVLLKSESLSINSILLRKTKQLMSKFPLKNQVKTAFALKKISRLLIIFIGTILCTNFLGIGIGLYYKQLTQVNELNDSTKFDNAYYFDEIEYSDNKNVAYIEDTNLKFDGKKQNIQIVGLNRNGNIFSDEIYEELQSNEIIIPKNIAYKNDLKTGDSVEIIINGKETKFKIGKILDSNYEHRCYVGLQDLYAMCLEDKVCNTFYEREGEEAIDNNILAKAVRKEKIEDYKKNNINSFSQILMIVGVLLAFSILAVIIVFTLISSLNIHDSLFDIKIMRFLGYSKRKIQSLTITTYLCMLIITMISGYLLFSFLCNKFENLINVSNWDFYLGVDSSLKIYLLSCTAVIFNYYFWMLLVYYTKVKKVK